MELGTLPALEDALSRERRELLPTSMGIPQAPNPVLLASRRLWVHAEKEIV